MTFFEFLIIAGLLSGILRNTGRRPPPWNPPPLPPEPTGPRTSGYKSDGTSYSLPYGPTSGPSTHAVPKWER